MAIVLDVVDIGWAYSRVFAKAAPVSANLIHLVAYYRHVRWGKTTHYATKSA